MTLAESGEGEKRMTRGKQLLWKLLFAWCLVCAIGSLLAWGVLLTAVCSTPHDHMPDPQHTIPYSCHGMTVFLSAFEESLHRWLIPTGALFTVLSVIAGVMVALSTGKVKVKMEFRVEDTSKGKPGDRGGHET